MAAESTTDPLVGSLRRVCRLYLKSASSANPQQHAQIHPYPGQKCGMGFGVKGSLARRPVQAFEMVHQHRAFNRVHGNRQSKGIRLPPAGKRTYNHQATGAIITLIGDDQGRAAFGLFASGLGIEIEPDDVAGTRHVTAYHSTSSRSRVRPVGSSPYRFSSVICATSSFRVGTRCLLCKRMCPSADSITMGSPSRTPASSATGLGMRTARLLPHFTICPCAMIQSIHAGSYIVYTPLLRSRGGDSQP